MYPKKPLQVIPIASIRSIRMIKEKSWHMKENYNYFEIFLPDREILACRHRNIAEGWVRGIFDAILFCQQGKGEGLREGERKRARIMDDYQGDIVDPNVEVRTPEKESPKKGYLFKKPSGSLS